MAKILALDIGEKRVGYAVSDEDAAIAFPRGFFERNPEAKFFEKLRAIISEDKISKIVLGVPLGEDNEETAGSEKFRKLGEKIGQLINLPVDYIDESGSTAEALSKIPLRKDRRKKGEDDAIAAQVILERYLDKPNLVAGAGFEPATSRL